jgi:uncharacterized membrane protein
MKAYGGISKESQGGYKFMHVVFYLLAVAPLIIFAIAWNILPQAVPAHFNSSGQIDRMGKKLELIILPLLTFIYALIFAYIGKKRGWARQDRPANMGMLLISLIVFDLMCIWSIATGFGWASGFSTNFKDVGLIGIIIGLVFVTLGLLMPWISPNAYIEIRLPGYDDQPSWGLLQRFGGKVCVIGGLALIVLSSFWLTGHTAAISIFLVSGAMVISIMVYAKTLRS